MPELPTVPETIVVHLGAPDEPAQNVTVSFPEYIKNVASSEIFPTWPTEAIKANVLAQISVALNRVYTEYYRSRGKDFDITNSTAYDQSFVFGRDIFENISETVDDIFNDYIRRQGNVEPLFATFCDGVEVSCNGLSQWGSVELADQGLGYLDILQFYYGDEIEIVNDAPIENVGLRYSGIPLRLGDTGRDVESMQIRLNRISANYPAIPKIDKTDGFFGKSTENAVKEFQRVFNLTPDGIIGKATWYKIQFIYNAVKKLYEVNSEGLKYGDFPQTYPGSLKIGDRSNAVYVLQYYLEYISVFVPTVQAVKPDGIFGPSTEASVISFQRTYGLNPDGRIDRSVWNVIQSTYFNILASVDYEFREGVSLPYPGRVLELGAKGDDVRALQEYLSFIARYNPAIPQVVPDGEFGPSTEAAVIAFNEYYGIGTDPARVTALTWDALTDLYEDLYIGGMVRQGQFPGYDIKQE